MNRFIFFMFTFTCFILEAADTGSIVIQNNYAYPINLLVTSHLYHDERSEHTVYSQQELKLPFKGTREIAFTSGAYKAYSDIDISQEEYEERYTVVYEQNNRKGHALMESLYISITAPYISMTQGYGPWKIEEKWVDPQQEEAELLDDWQEIVDTSNPTQDNGADLEGDWFEVPVLSPEQAKELAQDPTRDPKTLEQIKHFLTHDSLVSKSRENQSKFLDKTFPKLSQEKKEEILNSL